MDLVQFFIDLIRYFITLLVGSVISGLRLRRLGFSQMKSIGSLGKYWGCWSLFEALLLQFVSF